MQDTFTRTEADAAAFERRFGPDYSDDRPSLADLQDDPMLLDEDDPILLDGEPCVICTHNPCDCDEQYERWKDR